MHPPLRRFPDCRRVASAIAQTAGFIIGYPAGPDSSYNKEHGQGYASMTLRISLRDGEQMIVNGAVLRSVGRTDLCVENSVTLLRGREVMTPDEATTPARRLYYACMLAYIDPDRGAAHRDGILAYLADLVGALEAPEAKAACARFAEHVGGGDHYRALAECRTLIAYEAEVFARVTHHAF